MNLALGLLIGIVVGAFMGFLLAPAAQVWVGRKEWMEASRQLELADRLLETLAEPEVAEPEKQRRWPGTTEEAHA